MEVPLVKELYEACCHARAELGELVRDGVAPYDMKEAYELCKKACERYEARERFLGRGRKEK